VVGAHAQGFNSQTTAIASIGDHTTEAPTPEAQNSIVNYLAWRMAAAGATPVDISVQLTSGGGSENRWPAGAIVTVPRITGHRALGKTTCPGDALDPLIPGITSAVQKRIKAYAKPRHKKKKKKRKRKKGHHKKPGSRAVGGKEALGGVHP
jgi:N-acetylmuramoyl-L-alanine amidase